MSLKQFLKSLTLQQGCVSRRDNNGAMVVSEKVLSHQCGMTGTQLLMLPRVIVRVPEGFLDQLPAMPYNNDGSLDACRFHGPSYVLDHGNSADTMQAFR